MDAGTTKQVKKAAKEKLTRPVLRYHGGKFRLAEWIIDFFPGHRTYVEPYGGAASVLMLKPRSYAEVYNEADPEIVNVFRVLRDHKSATELKRLLELTPFARVEYKLAYVPTDDPIEKARRTIVKAFLGFGSDAVSRCSGMRTAVSTHKPPTGFRTQSRLSGTSPAHDWASFPKQLQAFCRRLQGVVIENRNALEVIRQHDGEDTLNYVDPPYVPKSRSRTGGYRFEMDDDGHRELAELLHQLKGMVVLSGYPSELYDKELFPDWHRVEKAHLADRQRKSTEVLWLNAAAVNALKERQSELFS